MTSDSAIFDSLPTFDPAKFRPPAWANGPAFDYTKKNGESSKSSRSLGAEPSRQTWSGAFHQTDFGPERSIANDAGSAEESEDEGDEVWEDAKDSLEEIVEDTPEGLVFTTKELQRLYGLAENLKAEGNKAYTAKPANMSLAVEKYEAALKHLPAVKKRDPVPSPTNAAPKTSSGIEEITDEEADIIRQAAEEVKSPDEVERANVEDQILDLTKACHGNLAACYAALKDDKKAVDACTKALEIDPSYTKALHRRATANDRIGSWSSLTSAKQDYEKLLQLLPRTSPQLPSIRTALLSLPRRIQAQQDKEKDEMIGQLKELGNGLLGKFGLSTDMFKFEQQEGGGYGLKFER